MDSIGIYNTCLVGSVGLCRLRALVIPVVFIILALWLPLSVGFLRCELHYSVYLPCGFHSSL